MSLSVLIDKCRMIFLSKTHSCRRHFIYLRFSFNMKPFCFCFCLILSINDVTSGFQTDLNVDSRFLQLENTILEQGKMINDLKKTVENQNFENAELHRRIDKLEAYVRKELTTESINGQHRNVLTEDIVEEDIVEEDKNKTIRRGKHVMKNTRFKILL